MSTPSPQPMSQPPPINPRVNTEEAVLPEPTELEKDDTAATGKYGSKKQTTSADAAKTGTSALRIPVNVGTGAGQQTGGANV